MNIEEFAGYESIGKGCFTDWVCVAGTQVFKRRYHEPDSTHIHHDQPDFERKCRDLGVTVVWLYEEKRAIVARWQKFSMTWGTGILYSQEVTPGTLSTEWSEEQAAYVYDIIEAAVPSCCFGGLDIHTENVSFNFISNTMYVFDW